jgi:hypothetical protein
MSLTDGDSLSHYPRMPNGQLTWNVVDEIAAGLGASEVARRKWRQGGRGVPAAWRIRITEALVASGREIALSDFDRLQPNPGRLAA